MCPYIYFFELQVKFNDIIIDIYIFSEQAALFGGADNLPIFLSRHTIPRVDIVVDPCAAILVLIVTGLLCGGIKQVGFYYNLLL